MQILRNVSVFWKSIFLLVMITVPVGLCAQESDKGEANISVDLAYKYMWRGVGYGDAPAIMPTLGYSKGNFEVYTWGAFALDDSYKEVNIGVSYTLGNFTIELVDYFYPGIGADFLCFKSRTTTHSVEAIATYEMEMIPFHVSVGTIVYGDDKKENGKNAYSTYAEAGYTHEFNSKNTLAAVAGFSVNRGFYTDYTKNFDLVNLSAAYTRVCTIKEYEVPVTAAYTYNPYMDKSWFNVAFSFSF